MSHINISYPTKPKLLYQFLQLQQLYRKMVACRFQLPKNDWNFELFLDKMDGHVSKWTVFWRWNGRFELLEKNNQKI